MQAAALVRRWALLVVHAVRPVAFETRPSSGLSRTPTLLEPSLPRGLAQSGLVLATQSTPHVQIRSNSMEVGDLWQPFESLTFLLRLVSCSVMQPCHGLKYRAATSRKYQRICRRMQCHHATLPVRRLQIRGTARRSHNRSPNPRFPERHNTGCCRSRPQMPQTTVLLELRDLPSAACHYSCDAQNQFEARY